MLRIEAGLIFAGYEFCDQTDPFEAGIGFTVPLKSKQDNFIGRDELIKRKESPQQKLVGLELSGEEAAGNGDGVFMGREQIGTITSAMISPFLRKNIALCKMKVIHTEPGTLVEVGNSMGIRNAFRQQWFLSRILIRKKKEQGGIIPENHRSEYSLAIHSRVIDPDH